MDLSFIKKEKEKKVKNHCSVNQSVVLGRLVVIRKKNKFASISHILYKVGFQLE